MAIIGKICEMSKGTKGAHRAQTAHPPRPATAVLSPDNGEYPVSVRRFFSKRPPDITMMGNPDLLRARPLAIFCSIRCPGDVILKLYDLVRALRDAGIPVIGGFHTPMEKECLDLLLRGKQPIIICPARGIEGMQVPKNLKPGFDAGRVLVVSPFPAKSRRITSDLAERRNLFIAALAREIFVAHAAPGGLTEKVCRELSSTGKILLTFKSPENTNLSTIGARAVNTKNLVRRLVP